MHSGPPVANDPSSRRSSRSRTSPPTRLGRRFLKALILGITLGLVMLGGGLWCAWWYITDSASVAKVIREHAVGYFQQAMLNPGRVRIRPFIGEVVLRQIQLIQRVDGLLFETIQIPYLNVRISPRAMMHGQLEMHEIVVVEPTLRIRQRQDGTWNIQNLFADPWPGPWIETPPILIRKATVELTPYEPPPTPAQVDPAPLGSAIKPPGAAPAAAGEVARQRSPVVLRDVALNIESNGGPGQVRFEGSARGDVFDRLSLNGTIDFNTGCINLDGELAELTLSETLRRRIPREGQAAYQALALNGGVIDVELSRFCYDPTAPPADRLHYQVHTRLRDGVWECAKLPFFINDVSAQLTLEERCHHDQARPGNQRRRDM